LARDKKLRAGVALVKRYRKLDNASYLCLPLSKAPSKAARRKLPFAEKMRLIDKKSILVGSRLDGHKARLARTLFALFGAN
jgi:hypothetical protein